MKSTTKKCLGALIFIFCGAMMMGQPAMAAEPCDYESILGMKPWYAGLKCDANGAIASENFEGDGVTNSIFTVVGNVTEDLTVIIGIVAVIFVIYGGYLYMMSAGDIGKVTKAKNTITSAIVGLVITMLARSVISFVAGIFGSGDKSANEILTSSLNTALGAAGVVAVVYIIISGVQLATSAGDAGKVVKAKKTLIAAIVGLAIVLLSFAIVNFVLTELF